MLDEDVVQYMKQQCDQAYTDLIVSILAKRFDALDKKGVKSPRVSEQWLLESVVRADPHRAKEKCKKNGDGRHDTLSDNLSKNYYIGAGKAIRETWRKRLRLDYFDSDGFIYRLSDFPEERNSQSYMDLFRSLVPKDGIDRELLKEKFMELMSDEKALEFYESSLTGYSNHYRQASANTSEEDKILIAKKNKFSRVLSHFKRLCGYEIDDQNRVKAP